MELHTGTMKTTELIQWFGISEATFWNSPDKYYNLLKLYCDYTKDVKSTINITKVYNPTYNKNYLKEIEVAFYKEAFRCIKQQEGLMSIRSMAEKLNLSREGLYLARDHLFGPLIDGDKESIGFLGCRHDTWAIQLQSNNYRPLSTTENRIFRELIISYKIDAPQIEDLIGNLLEDYYTKDLSGTRNFDQLFEYLTSKTKTFENKVIASFKQNTGFDIARVSQYSFNKHTGNDIDIKSYLKELQKIDCKVREGNKGG